MRTETRRQKSHDDAHVRLIYYHSHAIKLYASTDDRPIDSYWTAQTGNENASEWVDEWPGDRNFAPKRQVGAGSNCNSNSKIELENRTRDSTAGGDRTRMRTQITGTEKRRARNGPDLTRKPNIVN
ncbi:hypothetical protein V9T40_000198 [Parthenolecanium corni]|uniref:Uncharacterized protein n=1 Tax=Parthenolecanium corni TaxID=536013 RepID=A0AAN9Y0A1_9HEMI